MRFPRPGTPRYRSAAKAATFIWFTLVAMPLVFFSAAMAVDFTRIIIASRQVANVTSAAAMSGAWQMEPGKAAVNMPSATKAAAETFCVARRSGAISLSADAPKGTPGIPCPDGSIAPITLVGKDLVATQGGLTSGGYTTVEVRSKVIVEDLIFFSFFDADRVYTGPDIVRHASICVPGDAKGVSQGYCQRPID